MLPRTIWSLWFQGWANAPDLVKACAASWRRHNPGWDLRLLSGDTLDAHLDCPGPAATAVGNLPAEARSDLARIELLHRFGGIWVDATVYCLRPLDSWIGEATPSGFFAFNRPLPDVMLSSWFLAAERGSYLVDTWRRMVRAYWQQRSERDHYFWFHRLFAEACASDAKFRAIWEATPKLSADGPHCFAPYEEQLLKPVDARDRLIVETAQTPMLKLTHKIPHDRGGAGTTYRWLCDRVMSDFVVEGRIAAAVPRPDTQEVR
jgi:Capsular polysaccharide synthesis protein